MTEQVLALPAAGRDVPAQPLAPALPLGKRVFDVIFASLGLLLTAPVFAIVAVLMKCETSGPVFFRQTRVGRNRRLFRMWKFRKMFEGLPPGPSLTSRFDLRLTRLGRFLERTKLDELPQLINVLMGEMSIIGPRPEVPKFVQHCPEMWDEVLQTNPGVFGPNQLLNRNESELYPPGCKDIEGYYIARILPDKLRVDAEYARRASLLTDSLLMARCVLAVFHGAITWKSIARQRWQILKQLLLSCAAVGATLGAVSLAGLHLGMPGVAEFVCIGIAAKLVLLSALHIPKKSISSLHVDDLLRMFWCGMGSGGLTLAGMLLLNCRDLSCLALFVDQAMFIGFMFLYALLAYKLYVNFVVQRSRVLCRRLIVAAVVLGPVSYLSIVTARHGLHAWGSTLVTTLLLAGLAAAARPMLLVLLPVFSHERSSTWLMKETGKILLMSMVGSCAIVLLAFILNIRDTGRLDLLLDMTLYAVLLTLAGCWMNRRIPAAVIRDEPSAKRLLIVGDGVELSAVVATVLGLPEQRYRLVGIISPRSEAPSSMIGAHSVLGGLDDVPEAIRVYGVQRLLVLRSSVGAAQREFLAEAARAHGVECCEMDLLASVTGDRLDLRDDGLGVHVRVRHMDDPQPQPLSFVER